jgi:xanthine dehydrogenase accessory factor
LHTHFDLSAQELQRLHGPAGLYIGSKTPAEIALSIMAEVVAAKNGVLAAAPLPVAEGKAAALVGMTRLPPNPARSVSAGASLK